MLMLLSLRLFEFQLVYCFICTAESKGLLDISPWALLYFFAYSFSLELLDEELVLFIILLVILFILIILLLNPSLSLPHPLLLLRLSLPLHLYFIGEWKAIHLQISIKHKSIMGVIKRTLDNTSITSYRSSMSAPRMMPFLAYLTIEKLQSIFCFLIVRGTLNTLLMKLVFDGVA